MNQLKQHPGDDLSIPKDGRAIASRNLLIILLLAIVIVLIVQRCQHPVVANSADNVGTNNPMKYKDASGSVHTQVRPAQGAGYHDLSDQYKKTIDSLRKVLNTSRGSIKDVTEYNTETSGNFKPEYSSPTHDTIGCAETSVSVSYKDPWISISGSVDNDSSWTYRVVDTMALVTYEKKVGWFKRDLYVDIVNKNPNTTINGLRGIRIVPKPKQWAIGFTAGYVFDGFTIKPGVSVGITKTLVRW